MTEDVEQFFSWFLSGVKISSVGLEQSKDLACIMLAVKGLAVSEASVQQRRQ